MIDSDLFRSGDPAYFERLVHEHAPLVRDVALQLSDSDAAADELFQDIWVRAWTRRSTFNGGSFPGWLYRIGLNIRRDQHRREQARTTLRRSLDILRRADPVPDPLEEVERRSERAVIRDAVSTLPARQREALLLRLEGFTTAEIADHLSVAPATVRSLIWKGQQRITETLREKIDR